MKLARTRLAIAGGVAACALLAGPPALAQTTQTLTYSCNVENAPAQLTTQVTQVSDSAGGYNLQYVGQLVSRTARYTFVGENSYADFTNMNGSERFRVQFVVQGAQMMMIVNPQGPGPVQYMCQRTS